MILCLAFFENYRGLSVLLLADIDGAESLKNIGVIKVLTSEARNSDCLNVLLLRFLESLGQEIDATLDPLLSRAFVKKGKNFTVKLGSEDVEISPHFKLYLQTKLINPHYKPETAAHCTIINFIVTESGLED